LTQSLASVTASGYCTGSIRVPARDRRKADLEAETEQRRDWLVAHRGHAAAFPENTLPALRSALELGAAWLEFDIQLSADRIPVLCHDPNLQRTAGIRTAPWDNTWRELSAIAVAETARFGDRFDDVCMPSLAQAVELLLQWPDRAAFVEIKRQSVERFGCDAVVDAIAAVLAPLGERAVPISFDPVCVERYRELHGGRIGWVLPRWGERIRHRAEKLGARFLFCNKTRVGRGAQLWSGPWEWAIYEIEDPAEVQTWRSRGARLFETMRVREMAGVEPT
jgi:glycerophosphoryl diester phosphodiesterase